MIDVQPYIDRLDFLREVLYTYIDYWMHIPVMKEDPDKTKLFRERWKVTDIPGSFQEFNQLKKP